MIDMPFNPNDYFRDDSIRNIERLTTEIHQIVKTNNNIVHCKDCKYKVETEDGEWNPEDIVCDYWASDGLEADDFCSRGERKDG